MKFDKDISLIQQKMSETSIGIARRQNILKELNIERSRLSPSASIKISKTENRDFSTSVDEQSDETVKGTITWPTEPS